MTRIKKSTCDKNLKPKLWQNSKTQIVTELKSWNGNKGSKYISDMVCIKASKVKFGFFDRLYLWVQSVWWIIHICCHCCCYTFQHIIAIKLPRLYTRYFLAGTLGQWKLRAWASIALEVGCMNLVMKPEGGCQKCLLNPGEEIRWMEDWRCRLP